MINIMLARTSRIAMPRILFKLGLVTKYFEVDYGILFNTYCIVK